MRTIRRLYFYAVAFISMEVVLWGLIGLLRSIFAPAAIGGGGTRLAGALALILVGLPVFGLHWAVVQRDARRDPDEHASGIRAFFLYAVQLSTLIPAVQSLLALITRLFLDVSHLPRLSAAVGSQQTWSDNLIALLMNVLVAAYFLSVLRSDWKQVSSTSALTFMRRISRYLWVLYGLGLTVAGVQQVVQFILQIPPIVFGLLLRATLINGLALTLVGAPLWVWAWKTVQDSLAEPPERESLLRLGLLYALSLAGVITVLTSSGIVLDLLLRQIFGENMPLQELVQKISGPLSIGIPLAGVWAYYSRWLARSLSEVPELPRRSGMRRLYSYILSAVGLAAAFLGLRMLLGFVVDALLASRAWGGALRLSLAAALATLAAGLPLWLFAWRPMQAEALSPGDAGDHARRSLVRRIYLYLALFASVIGGMVSAGTVVYLLLKALLNADASGILQGVLDALEFLVLFALLGLYHGLTLRQDGKTAGRALAEKHAAFPALVFDVENGSFGPAMLAAIQKQAPHLPAAVKWINQPFTEEAPPRAVLLPADLALDPPASLQKWLAGYTGSRLVVPRSAAPWVWVGGAQADLNQAALALRQLAEGLEIRQKAALSGWTIFIYVIAGLFGLELLGLLVSLAGSLFYQ